jgi:hypothetical protein
MLPFLYAKVVSFKIVHPLNIYQNTKIVGPKLTGARFTSSSEVRTSTILEYLQLGIKNYGVEVTFNVMTSLLNFIKI